MRRLPVTLLTGVLIAAALVLPAGPAMANAQRDAIDQLNSIRAANGLSQLGMSRSLHRSATRYARRMISSGYFGHSSRIAVGSRFGRAGETLAMHSGWDALPTKTVTSWMSSATHRAVLMSTRYRWIGIGIARGRGPSGPVTVWVAHVGG